MKIHTNIEQRSEEWHQLRIGRVTGTRIAEMAAGKPPTFETLCRKIVSERMTGQSSERVFVNDAMENGIALEDEARAVYEMETLTTVEQVGFISRDDLLGISPDGLVGEDGLVEIKCPLSHTHLGYLLANGKAWKAYKHQLLGQLWVSGREWVDFVSYSPMFPEDKRLLIERVKPDAEYFALLDEKAKQLRARVEEILAAIA